jgi:CheY-like chemotaxis protein
VDDQEEIRRLVEITLSVEDYQILQAESGEEAIDIVKVEKPDLIIMDIMMPGGMDGLEATRILKNDPETKACPIIMLTGKGQQREREDGLATGADDYFAKPFSPLELIRKVEKVLG